MYRHSVRVVGFAFVAALWLSTGLMLAAFVYEVAWYDVTQWLAKARRAFNSPEPNAGKPNNLTYYRPFYPRYLHPIYLLYYPLDPDDRVALSNTVVSLTRDGFRGDAPDFTRQLMFILGGSAAFGYGASSDRTTISGYFNILQADVQAINAAVIGWNSTQELARFANQIASLKPHLVISYSLFNDIYVALSYATQGINLPPGSPLGFDSLSNIVRDLTPPSLKRKLIFSLENLFPRTTKLIAGKRTVHSGNDIHPALDAAVDKFIDNEKMMYHISNDIGFTFVTVIQPILYAHNLPNLDTGGEDPSAYRYALQRALTSDYCTKHCLNYSNIFDKDFNATEIVQTIFVDPSHLTDAGNRYVASRLIADLKLLGGSTDRIPVRSDK